MNPSSLPRLRARRVYHREMRVAVLLLIAACYEPSAPAGAPCENGAPCPSGQSCSVDQICVVGPGPDACAFEPRCEGDDLVTCTGSTSCDHGCNDAHCLELVPSNGISPDLLLGATADLRGDKLDFDTETGGIKDQSNVVRAPGPGIPAPATPSAPVPAARREGPRHASADSRRSPGAVPNVQLHGSIRFLPGSERNVRAAPGPFGDHSSG